MTRLRRTIGGIVVAALLLGSLAACSPGIPYAWRLNADGTVSFTFCDEWVGQKIEAEYFKDDNRVAFNVGAGPTGHFGAGAPTTLGPQYWLTATNDLTAVDWDRFQFTLYGSERPAGYVYGDNGPSERPDGLLLIDGNDVDRVNLRLDEWIWDSGYLMGKPSCAVSEVSVADPAELSETIAMDEDRFRELLNLYGVNGSIGDVTEDLVSTGLPQDLIAFQTRLLRDLQSQDTGAANVSDALGTTYGATVDEDILFAAPLAADRLGFAWDPAVVPLNSWAHDRFPDSLAFVSGTSP